MAATFNAPALPGSVAPRVQTTRPAAAAAGGATPSSDVGAGAAVSAHEALTDPHPQYLTEVEADALYLPIGGGGSVSMAAATLSISPAKFGAAEVTVVDAGMTALSLVSATLVPNADHDADDLEGLTVIGLPAAGSCLFTLMGPGPLGGDYRINYTRG